MAYYLGVIEAGVVYLEAVIAYLALSGLGYLALSGLRYLALSGYLEAGLDYLALSGLIF